MAIFLNVSLKDLLYTLRYLVNDRWLCNILKLNDVMELMEFLTRKFHVFLSHALEQRCLFIALVFIDINFVRDLLTDTVNLSRDLFRSYKDL